MPQSPGGGQQTLPPPPPPPRSPYPPRPPRRGDTWSPGTFSPAIFLVALLVIGILVAVGVLSQRGRASPAATTATGQGATAVPAGPAPSTAPPRTFIVANTGGEGVYLRRTPRLDDRDTAYADGTRLVAIGNDVTNEDQLWRHVRAPDGKTGYVPAKYTTEAPR